MAAHSSILVRVIPWTEAPGGLQFMESRKSWTGLSDSTHSTSHAEPTTQIFDMITSNVRPEPIKLCVKKACSC